MQFYVFDLAPRTGTAVNQNTSGSPDSIDHLSGGEGSQDDATKAK